MHNLFKNSKKANYPYDYLICDNFLKKYQEYDSSYPLDYLSNSIRMSRDLTYGDPTYENIYSTKFLDLHNYRNEGHLLRFDNRIWDKMALISSLHY